MAVFVGGAFPVEWAVNLIVAAGKFTLLSAWTKRLLGNNDR